MTPRPRSPDGYYEWHEETKQWVPVPPSEQPPGPGKPKNRRPLLILVGVIGGAFLLLILSIAISGGSSKPSPTPQPVAASAEPTKAPVTAATPVPATPAPKAAAPVRDGSCAPKPCQNDSYGWIVTVANLKYDAPGGFGGQHPAEPGSVFVTIDLTFTNKLATEQHANSTEFVLKDGSGVKHSTAMVYTEACPGWSAVNLTQGASFGPKCTVFEAAAGKPSPLVLTWSPHYGVDYDIPLS